jgi:hypothetical protein
MRMNYLWIALALVACNSRKEEPAQQVAQKVTEPPAPAAPTFDKLHVTVSGKPLAVTRAMIKRMPSGRSQVFLGNYSATCQELLDNMFEGGKDHVDILANTATRLAPDGSQSTIVSDLSFDGPGEVADGSKASVTSFDGKSVDVALDFKGTGMAKAPVEVHGSFAAENCGDQRKDSNGVPKAAHPSTATITIAGKQLPLRGAIRKDGDVMLSVSPRDCSSWNPWAEMRLDRKFGQWRVSGDWFGQEYSNTVEDPMAKVKVVAGAKGTSADGPTVQLELSGTGKVEKYAVAIAGKIEAIDCPKE